MDNSDVELVGGPCGQHGPYTFYKAFKYTKNGIKRLVTLSEFFFVKLWIDSDLLCIGELQLLWSDKNSEQVLASLRLYFLPENTPEGRMDHGEDEVLAISEKVVLRVEDLITWITVDAEWTWGRLAKCESEVKEPPKSDDNRNVIGGGSLNDGSLDFSDVEKEKLSSDCDKENRGPLVVILSYPRYCRYRAMMRRLEGVENEFLKYNIVNALGGFTACTKNTRVLFCKDTFDYPELEGHELLCNHLAPKLKGRPRGKRKKRSVSPGSESNESESSVSNIVINSSSKILQSDVKNGLKCDTSLRRSTRGADNSEEKDFLKELTTFMKTNYTPIGKIPSLGYKELNLYSFYTKVHKLGGYDSVTANRLWKSIFDDMSGHANSTSAATVIRRHYERFLLPYERHQKGEEYKPLPVSERRRLKSKTGSSTSDVETSESTSRSGNSTPVPQTNPATPTTPENKDFPSSMKLENGGKPSLSSSSLRSVRVKTERQKDPINSDPKTVNNSSVNSPEIKGEIISDEDSSSTPIVDNNQTPASPACNKKCENNNIKPEPIEKEPEPLTSAVAPRVQSPNLKPQSQPEGKENTLLIKTGDTPAKTAESVPYKQAKSPEPIKTAEFTTNISPQPPFLQEVKKRKLDILKEGGLEVTPVRSKDSRPSVIQPTGAVKPVKQIVDMPPPAPPKKLTSPTVQTTPPSSIQTPQFSFVNGTGPPKVLQSKSIYSYSEKIVYGNPKDFVAPQTYQVHTPKFVGVRQQGGDILDLTVTSPQKPVVEIMKIPPAINPPHFGASNKQYKLPPQARRLGSNLEITLVDSNKSQIQTPPSNHHRYAPQVPSYKPIPTLNNSSRNYTHKRLSSEAYNNYKVPKMDYENGKYGKTMTASSVPIPTSSMLPTYDPKLDLTIPQPYHSRNNYLIKPEVTKASSQLPPKHYQHPPSPSHFPFLPPQLYDNKSIPPYLPILTDPSIYYSAAMHSLYSHSATPPVLPFPTSEQLKFYTELMAHNSRLNYNFPMDGTNPSILNESNFKKP